MPETDVAKPQVEEDAIDAGMKQQIDTVDDMGLYFLINECGSFTWRMQHDRGHGRIPDADWPAIEADMRRISKIQKYAISTLSRFGIEKPFNENGTGTAEYWAWFRWWDSWVKNMPQEKWRELESKLRAKADVSSYRPEGDWRANVEEEKANQIRGEALRKTLGL